MLVLVTLLSTEIWRLHIIVSAKCDTLPFKVIYQESKMVKLTAPYIPSFLGFREADILSEMVLTDDLFV